MICVLVSVLQRLNLTLFNTTRNLKHMKKLCLAVVHGIGLQRRGYSNNFTFEVRSRFKKITGADLITKEIIYADVLDHVEERLWQRVEKSHVKLRYKTGREFFITYIADAILYQRLPGNNGPYTKIHSQIMKQMTELARDVDQDTNLCIVAHSMGSVVMSNILWDMTKRPEGVILNESMRRELIPATWDLVDRLQYLWTLGSPIAIWSAIHEEPKPIAVPGKSLRHRGLNTGWRNILDPDDVIAYPLSGLGSEWKFVQDIRLNVGDSFTGWNPLSHIMYWSSNAVIDLVVSDLVRSYESLAYQGLP